MPLLRIPLIRFLAWSTWLLLLGGCATAPKPEPEPAPATPQLPVVTQPPPAPEPEPEPAPISEPVTEAAPPPPPERVVDPVAKIVIQRLARQLRIPEDQVEVAQMARADWPNTCLGLAADGEICGQAITPGYAISLTANGQRFEFRTDEKGRQIRLASAPVDDAGKPLVTWRDSQSFNILIVGTKRISFGTRGRALLTAPLAVPERARELEQFLAMFSTFQARTPAGEITLNGVGTTVAGPTEQRLVAEWARKVWDEAFRGLDTPAPDRALVWRREGGLAGFCDSVVIGRTGTAAAYSCRTDGDTAVSRLTLSSERLGQIYAWLDRFESTIIESGDAAGADAMSLMIELDGNGVDVPSENDREAIIAFVNAIVRDLIVAPSR